MFLSEQNYQGNFFIEVELFCVFLCPRGKKIIPYSTLFHFCSQRAEQITEVFCCGFTPIPCHKAVLLYIYPSPSWAKLYQTVLEILKHLLSSRL